MHQDKDLQAYPAQPSCQTKCIGVIPPLQREQRRNKIPLNRLEVGNKRSPWHPIALLWDTAGEDITGIQDDQIVDFFLPSSSTLWTCSCQATSDHPLCSLPQADLLGQSYASEEVPHPAPSISCAQVVTSHNHCLPEKGGAALRAGDTCGYVNSHCPTAPRSPLQAAGQLRHCVKAKTSHPGDRGNNQR